MDITTRVGFDDSQDVVVPPYKIIKSVKGLVLWGSDISVTNNSFVLAKAKINCALEISEDILNSRPMAFCCSYAVCLCK